MRRIPKDIIPGILWFISSAQWNRNTRLQHRRSFIEIALTAAHLTGGNTAPRGANLRTLGSSFGAAFAAIMKLADVRCNDIPYPWTDTFQKQSKVNSKLGHGANPTAGILVGPSNTEWESATQRATHDIAAARLISEAMLGPPPTYRQALCRWRPDPETEALAYTALLVQEHAPTKVRVSTKRQIHTPKEPPPKAREGPCFNGCRYTHTLPPGHWQAPMGLCPPRARHY